MCSSSAPAIPPVRSWPRRCSTNSAAAGSFPTGEVNPLALTVVEGLGFDRSEFRSKSWEEFATPDAPALDFIFTVCDNAAGELCPIWPGQPMSAHWGVLDPAALEGTETEKAIAFADACRMLRNRIRLFIEMPRQALNHTSLQRKLDEIGKTADERAPQI